MNNKEEKSVIGILIICVVILISFIIYLVFFKLENKEEDVEIREIKVNTFQSIIGTYEYSDGELSKILIINTDGTGEYQYKDACGEDECMYQKQEGAISIGIDKIYLIDKSCKMMIVGDTCEYSNCIPIITFNYDNDGIKIDGVVLSKK